MSVFDVSALRSLGEIDAEHALECWAERTSDRLDRLFMAGEITEAEYKTSCREIGRTVSRLFEAAFPQ